jgi:tripartite-type tricarboxylate transporter receptor subunit TctC
MGRAGGARRDAFRHYPALIARLEKVGIEAASSRSPAEFGAFIRSETDRWSKVLKQSGNLKLD